MSIPEPQVPSSDRVSWSDYCAIIDDKKRRPSHIIGKKMVGWFNIGQLFRTANEVVISTIFGRHMDRRGYQALENIDRKVFDYSVELPEGSSDLAAPPFLRIDAAASDTQVKTTTEKSELWLDYISDIGDGWDSTYAVAYWANQPELKMSEEVLPRGEVVIFGGDEVYPTASKDEYENRLIHPYRIAARLSNSARRSHLYAIPGNHDWYDSLVNFSKIFLAEDYFADSSFRTPQDRSYFVLKLPHHWWLVGIDLQLESDIDGGQIEYLKQAAKLMEDGDKVILCSPEPYWVYGELYQDATIYNRKHSENRLYHQLLEEKVFTTYDSNGDLIKKQDVSVYLAGDLHHYFRFESEPDVHKITAGGGGAFLHPTHGELENNFSKTFRAAFPTFEDSRRLTWLNVWFPYLNRTFGLLTSFLYVLASWTVVAFVNFTPEENKLLSAEDKIVPFENLLMLGMYLLNHPLEALSKCWFYLVFACQKTLLIGIQTPTVILFVLVIGGGFWVFTDTESKRYKMVAGPLHAIIHVVLALLINWFVFWLTVGVRSTKVFTFPEWSLLALLICAIGLYYLWNEGISYKLSFGCAAAFFISSTIFVAQNNNPLTNKFSWGWDFKTPSQVFFSGVLVCLLSYFISSLVMGLYLWGSLNLFSRHSNEAFSALGIEDWKNFLRLHITKNGELKIYPIGIRRVPRNWEKVPLTNGANTYQPASGDGTPPHLIEGAITVPPSKNFKEGSNS